MNLLDPSLNWTCGLSPEGTLECLDVATWHGFRLTEDRLRIECMMASCESHRARMKADYEHPMESACGVPGSHFVWPENFCYVEWGDESALTGEVEAEHPQPYVKTLGLAKYAPYLASADSMAWSYHGRRTQPCRHGRAKSEANCLPFALAWRERILRALNGPTQPYLWEAVA